MLFLAGTAGVIDINGTVIVELITFLVMTAILARYVYPEIVKLAEARQRQVTEQLKDAERARAAAEATLKEAEAKLVDARKTAQSVIDAAGKSAEQLRQELKQKAEDEAKRLLESARKEIEAERGRRPGRGGDREGHRRDAGFDQAQAADREGHRGGCEWQRPPLGATRGRCSSLPRRRGESMSGCAISRPSAISWAIPLWLQCSRTRPFPPRAAWS